MLDGVRRGSPQHQHPIIEVEQYGGIVIVAGLERKIRARPVLGRNPAQPQRRRRSVPGSSAFAEISDDGTMVPPSSIQTNV